MHLLDAGYHCTQVQEAITAKIPMTADTVSNIAVSYLEEHGLSGLLFKNGGRFKAAKSWCNVILSEMEMPRRKCTTQASKLPEDWEVQQERLNLQVIVCDVC